MMKLRCDPLLVEIIVDGKKYRRDEFTGVFRYTEMGVSIRRGASGRKVLDRHTKLISKKHDATAIIATTDIKVVHS